MKDLLKKLAFPKDDAAFMLKLNALLTPEEEKTISRLKKIFFMKNTDKTQAECAGCVMEELDKMAEAKEIHKFSYHLLFLLLCCKDAKESYEKAGYCEELFYDSMYDLTCKLKECRTFHGITGVFAFRWLHSFFLLKIFGLGRFQYAKGVYRQEKPYSYGGTTVNPGDNVYYIHIPATGSMPEEARIASYKKAYEFFGPNNGDYIVLVCESWLLDPENRNIFPENSNMLGFLDDFDIVHRFETEHIFNDSWRVFNLNYSEDMSKFPEDTVLQRNYKKWLEAGKKVGYGYGVIIFDGEKIVNK